VSTAADTTSAAPGLLARLKDPSVRRGLVLPLALIVLWEVVTRYKLVNVHLLVRPELVVTGAVEAYRNGDIVVPLIASLKRDFIGLLLGTVAGFVVGGAMGLSRLSERIVGPSFHAAKQVAIFAWIPLISVWFTGEPAKIVFIALAAFYPVVVNTHEGIQSVAKEHLEVARVFRFSRFQVLRRVIVPSAVPSFFSGLHLALIYSWLGTLGAEYLLAPAPGIGNLMIDGREQFAMDKVLLGVILAGLVGALLNAIAATSESRLLGWRVKNV
jgi:sulfonate transport system permease protein